MSANTTPIFILAPNTSVATIGAANTARDGSGALVTVFTAGADGSRLDSIDFTSAQATAAASSAMVWNVFITDTAGANPRLFKSLAQVTITPSTTVISATGNLSFGNGLLLTSGQLVRVTQTVYAGVQDKVDVIARGGNY